MTKKEVRNMVLQNGKPLNMSRFIWDNKTNTFSSDEDNLVIMFINISYCTFKTGSYCTFKTGSDCTFKTGSDCTFDTGSDCTFDTGSYCTFKTGSDCVIIRRDIFQVISQKTKVILCPYNIIGYLEKINNEWYLNGDIEKGQHIIVDGILSRIIRKKGNIYKVINHNEKDTTYLITDGMYWSHGKTYQEAKKSLIYKRVTKDLTKFKSWKLSDIKKKDEFIEAYRSITGACEGGVRYFIENNILPKKCTVEESIRLTENQYNNIDYKNFFMNNNNK